jgi:hypothetical protein
LHESLLSNECDILDANHSTQLKKSRINNPVVASAKQMQGLFCEVFNSPASSVPWQEEAI